MDSSSPYGVLLDESCDGEEKRTFEKECEAADALVQISGMLVDAAQILRDCHKVRRRQIYGHFDVLVKPTLTPNAKRSLYSLYSLSLYYLHKLVFRFIDHLINFTKCLKTYFH